MKRIILFICTILLVTMVYADDMITSINSLRDNQLISNDSLFTILSNWQNYSQPDETDTFLLEYNQINDSLNAPYVVYIPEEYDYKKQTPLVIYLHGGVSTIGFDENPIKYAEQNYFTEYAKEKNWIAVYPMGNNDTAWWNLTGINNLKAQIRKLKSQYNIDDNRIYISGFSDGGSGSFHLALNAPDDFASFYPLNGMISVGSAVTQIPVYLPNLKNRPVYTINTDKDGLYPAKEMRKFVKLSLEADADIFYKEYWDIGHSFDYAEDELPILFDDMKIKTRNTFRSDIYWETSMLEYGKCDWLQISGIDTLLTPKKWQKKYNIEIADERVSFGFYNDREYKGIGTKISRTVPGSASETMKLLENDIIIKMDNAPADSIAKLLELRNKKKRGDKFTLTVIREDQELKLKGQFPDIGYYDAFSYTTPSGAVKAIYYGNRFVIETSRVSEVAIYLHPQMVNMDIPVVVEINGNEVLNEIIEIDRDFMINNYLENFDRKALWVNRIILDVD